MVRAKTRWRSWVGPGAVRLAAATATMTVGFGCGGRVEAKVTVTPPRPAPTVAAEGQEGVPPDGPPPPTSPAEPPEPGAPETGTSGGTDPDGDGVVGAADRCPEAPETNNGFEDDDGCPDDAPMAYLAGDRLVTKRKIAFAPGGRVSSASDEVLTAVAAVLEATPEVDEVEVGVWFAGGRATPADATGSRNRAAEVRSALVRKGIGGARLRSKGYGRCKAAANVSAGDAVVALRVVTRGGARTEVALGCDGG